MPTIYQCVIGDGVTYSVERHEEGSPGHESYWIGLRLAEVGCPVCDQVGQLDDGRECPECHGSTVTQGEAFTVYRFVNVPEDVAEEMCDDPGDGYEWTRKIGEIAAKHGWGEGVQVLEWEPERAVPVELVQQTILVLDDGETWSGVEGGTIREVGKESDEEINDADEFPVTYKTIDLQKLLDAAQQAQDALQALCAHPAAAGVAPEFDEGGVAYEAAKALREVLG